LKQRSKLLAEEHNLADKRIGLGRGIGALIPTSDNPNEAPIDVFFPAGGSTGPDLVAVPGARFGHLEISSIRPNAKQPRSVFEPEAFAELVHSIKELGVLQPIVVRSIPDEVGKYELIMGERRLRASKEAGLTKIPAVIRETADENMLRDALLENLHRSDLNPLEEASAYQQLLEDFGITQEELANRIGRSRPKLTNSIRLLKLPAEVQRKVAAGVLSAGHARALLGIEDDARQLQLANKVINEGLSVRSLEEIVAVTKPAAKGKVRPGSRQDLFKGLADQVGDHLSTSVKISIGKGRGIMAIEFASLDDLKRIISEIGVDAEY
jgi:ParB family chromosome partitioning protein